MGRASLARALESVAAQALQDVEVVVVNASGDPLPPPAAGALSLRLLQPGVPLGRSAAANALLDAAQGTYRLFLDDDDWLLPDHLGKLAAALQQDGALVAAYSDVECVAEAGTAGQRTVTTYERDFDAAALQLQNFLPIHSVMFRGDVVDAQPPLRFAGELELFEDWDFWLQLAGRGAFRRVPGISAIYAIDAQAGSGHSDLDNARRREMLTRLGQRQLARWQPADVARLIERDVAQSTHLRALEQTAGLIPGLEQSAAQLQAALDQLRRDNEDAQRVARELSAANAQAHQVNLELAAANQAAHQVNTALREANAALHEANLELQRVNTALGDENERVSGWNRDLTAANASLQSDIAQAQELLRAQRAELDTLTQVRLDLLRDIAYLQGEVASRDHRIALMENSISWKLTRPLRATKRAVQDLSQARPEPLVRAARVARNVGRAVQQDVQRNGIDGFARRLPYYLRHHRAYLGRLGAVTPGAGPTFQGTPPQLLDVRLHPDLAQQQGTIDASVSVVIPTLNAGAEFVWLLRKLRAQAGLRQVEIVIVDSGSKDGTVAHARAAGAKVIEILPSEFSHSYARNLGAQHASGDYLLFMVQDAYPIGQRWLHGMLSFLREHAPDKLAAVSCAEYSRSDSDMMYDSMINTHYKFLGCLEHDRLGEWRGDDHMALRSQGQLSDVSCLIPRELFDRYKYRGDYAEDLDLGIRLIKDGMKVAMLASVKTVHSHNRPAWYYLKRTYVDVIFLVGMFDDFTYPKTESLQGLVAGIVRSGAYISRWLADDRDPAPRGLLSEQLAQWIAGARQSLEQGGADGAIALREPKLDDFITRIGAQHLPHGDTARAGVVQQEARRFVDMFLARLEHFNRFAADVYGPQDGLLRAEAADVIRKTYGATVGAALAFYCLDQADATGPVKADADAIRAELVAGV